MSRQEEQINIFFYTSGKQLEALNMKFAFRKKQIFESKINT